MSAEFSKAELREFFNTDRIWRRMADAYIEALDRKSWQRIQQEESPIMQDALRNNATHELIIRHKMPQRREVWDQAKEIAKRSKKEQDKRINRLRSKLKEE